MAAEDLQKFFYEATGITLSVIPDTQIEEFSSNVRYFSVGNTRLLSKAGIGLDEYNLGANGYILKTYLTETSSAVFMAGQDGYGTLYAVQDFLNELFDYEIYAVYAQGGNYVGANYTGEYFIETDVRNKEFFTLEKTVVSDIDYLISSYYAVQYDKVGLGETKADLAEKKAWATRMGYRISSEILANSDTIPAVHNLVDFVPYATYSSANPEWYSNYYNSSISASKVQLCLSNETMYTQVFLPALKNLILANPDKEYVSLTQEDYQNTWCTCSLCLADKSIYGTNAGNYLKFVNKAAKDVQAWLNTMVNPRTVNIVAFAYYDTAEAPVVKDANGKYIPINESVKLEDNVVIYWVAARSGEKLDWSKPINHSSNYSYYESLLKWSALTDRLMIWSYDNTFVNYMAFFNTFDSLQENMQIFASFGAEYVMNQGGWNNRFGGGFTDLKIYLSSKLRWDTEANYNALVDDFFVNYYKDSAVPMQALYNKLLENTREFSGNGYSGAKDQNVLRRSFYSRAFLAECDALISEAYQAIERYEQTNPTLYNALYNRILREDLNVRYAWIMLYGVDVYKRNASDVNDLYLTYFGSYCPENQKLSYAETVALQNSFLADAKRVGLQAVAEQKYLSYLETEWLQWQTDNASKE